MREHLIRERRVSVDRLIEAVARRNPDAVAAVLNPLDRADLEAVAIILADFVDPEETLVNGALVFAARAFHVTQDDLLSPSRRRECIDARAVACYSARLLGFSYPRIGKAIERDHTTVMAACSRVGETPRLRGIAQRIAEQLGWDREEGAA